MKFSKQALLGSGVLLGGCILLYATLHQVNNPKPAEIVADTPASATTASAVKSENISNTPLTADIQTEKNILAQKQKERESRVDNQEFAAEQYLNEQQKIEAQALARSRAENQLYTNTHNPNSAHESSVKANSVTEKVAPITDNANNAQTKVATTATTTISNSKPKTPEITTKNNDAQTKSTTTTETVRPSSYQVKKGEGLIGLSRRYNIPVSILAQVNGLQPNASLHVGQTLRIPSPSEATRLQQEKQAYELAQQKLKDARQTVKETDAKGNFGVQVALATDQAKANEIVKKLQSAGYKVTTSQTTRGVRIVIGPETGKVAALALKDKVNSDPRIGMSNAWVLYYRY